MEIFSWRTSDQLNIHACYWPVSKPIGIIGIIHGLGEHAGRYQHVAHWLNAHNLAVVAYDRRGHGKSEGKRGHCQQFSDFLDEVAQLHVAMEIRCPDAPAFLYGHSMGGNILLNYLIDRNPELSGAIVTGPHIRLSFQPSAVQVGLGKMMRNLFPGFTQSNGLDVNKLSRDRAVVEAYQKDPLVHDRLTASTGIGMLEAAARLDAFSGHIKLPLLVMHGSKDGITSAAASSDFAKRVSGPVSCKIWDGLYHEIHNEPEQEAVFAYCWQWIQSLLPPA